MQPDERRRGKTQQGVSRARILLKKHLGWLPGFPLAGEESSLRWWCMPPGAKEVEVVSIDRERLRRMEAAVTKLRYRFPKALPKVVEDVDDWLGRMDHLMAILKKAVHRGRAVDGESWLAGDILPRRWAERFSKLCKKHAPLRPLLDAVLFMEATGPRRPTLDALDWIEEHAASLRGLSARGAEKALELQLLLFNLRDEMHPALQSALFECLADESIWLLPKDDVCDYAQQLSRQLKLAAGRKPFTIPQRPQRQSMGEAFVGLLLELIQLKPKPRRLAAKLLSLLVPPDFVVRSRALNAEIEREESRLLDTLRRLDTETSTKPRGKLEKKQLKRFAIVDVHTSCRHFVENVSYAVERVPKLAESPSLTETWIRFLNHLEAHEAELRAGLFIRWEQLRKRRHNRELAARGFQHILTHICRLIGRRGLNGELLFHWRNYYQSGGYSSEFVENLLDDTTSREPRERAIRLLEETLYNRGLSLGPNLMCSLEEFAEAIPDLGRAAEMLSALASKQKEGAYYWTSAIRAAAAIADDNAKAAEILLILEADYDLHEPIGLLGSRIRDARLRGILERTILKGDKKLLLSLGACTQLLADLGFGVPEVPDVGSPAAWIDRYPSALHEPVRQLCRVAEDAEAIAESLLGKDFPQEAKLRREIAALRERLAATEDDEIGRRLGKRLENLEKRIEAPRTATPRRLANLAERVRARVDREIVASYLRNGYDLAADKLKSQYGLDRLPEELFKPPLDRLLSGAIQLKGDTKKLGMRLLLHCVDDTASDFSSQPKNAAFREKLEAKGINMEPWLSETFDLSAKTGKDEPYRLFFTREIIDYLMMGFHFDTCLSPGNCNFFSTIANAVDINKQVVYGKTRSGRVIGRCLLTLTDQGSILTYNRYAHDPADGFAEAVDRFATRLAEAMNTQLISSGKVSTLVAKDWYDDGAVETEAVLNLRSANGVVRTMLRTAEPLSVVKRAKEILGNVQTIKAVIGSLLFAEEFTERPEIVGPFVDAYGLDEELTFNERFRLAILAHAAGLKESAETILVSLHPNTLPARLKRNDRSYYYDFRDIGSYREVFDLLIAYYPTIALRTIRATRPHDVRRDTDEKDRKRRNILADIHRALGREQLATQLIADDS